MDRRNFFKHAGALGIAVAASQAGQAASVTTLDRGGMPMIRLGTLSVSRVFLGSNPFFGFSHGNPQATGQEMRQWYTPDRIMDVLDQAADLGVNAVWTPCYDHWLQVWNAYRDRGGKLRHWIAQPDCRPMEQEIGKAIENGASAVCVQGCNIDQEVRQGNWDVVRGWLELIKQHELPAGMATHGATTHLQAEDRRLPTDFYHQTMYRPDNYVAGGLEESLATIEQLEKPVVGYKVLGAGRIKPADTLPYVFQRLKPKDGICVGVFPKHNRHQIQQNVALTRNCSQRS